MSSFVITVYLNCFKVFITFYCLYKWFLVILIVITNDIWQLVQTFSPKIVFNFSCYYLFVYYLYVLLGSSSLFNSFSNSLASLPDSTIV